MSTEKRKVDLVNFTKILDKISTTINLSELQHSEVINNNLEAFNELLDHPYKTPQSVFDEPLAYGAFKETYNPLSASGYFVIKFVSNFNETDREIEILEKAEEEDLNNFFIPTFYMHLNSVDISSNYIDSEEPEYFSEYNSVKHKWTTVKNPDFEETRFTDICVQPFAKIAREENNTLPIMNWWRSENICRKNFAENYPNAFCSFENAYKLAQELNDYTWWETAYNLYGLEKCLAMANFIEENGICDLHSANYGYMELNGTRYPVLMDWLSGRGQKNHAATAIYLL